MFDTGVLLSKIGFSMQFHKDLKRQMLIVGCLLSICSGGCQVSDPIVDFEKLELLDEIAGQGTSIHVGEVGLLSQTEADEINKAASNIPNEAEVYPELCRDISSTHGRIPVESKIRAIAVTYEDTEAMITTVELPKGEGRDIEGFKKCSRIIVVNGNRYAKVALNLDEEKQITADRFYVVNQILTTEQADGTNTVDYLYQV